MAAPARVAPSAAGIVAPLAARLHRREAPFFLGSPARISRHPCNRSPRSRVQSPRAGDRSPRAYVRGRRKPMAESGLAPPSAIRSARRSRNQTVEPEPRLRRAAFSDQRSAFSPGLSAPGHRRQCRGSGLGGRFGFLNARQELRPQRLSGVIQKPAARLGPSLAPASPFRAGRAGPDPSAARARPRARVVPCGAARSAPASVDRARRAGLPARDPAAAARPGVPAVRRAGSRPSSRPCAAGFARGTPPTRSAPTSSKSREGRLLGVVRCDPGA
jgi:hypothetical protein